MSRLTTQADKGRPGPARYALRKTRVIGLVLLFLAALLGAYYLHFAWHRFYSAEAQLAINLNKTVAALLDKQDIATLAASPSSDAFGSAHRLGQALETLVQVNPTIEHAYLVGMDSEGALAVWANASAAENEC